MSEKNLAQHWIEASLSVFPLSQSEHSNKAQQLAIGISLSAFDLSLFLSFLASLHRLQYHGPEVRGQSPLPLSLSFLVAYFSLGSLRLFAFEAVSVNNPETPSEERGKEEESKAKEQKKEKYLKTLWLVLELSLKFKVC